MKVSLFTMNNDTKSNGNVHLFDIIAKMIIIMVVWPSRHCIIFYIILINTIYANISSTLIRSIVSTHLSLCIHLIRVTIVYHVLFIILKCNLFLISNIYYIAFQLSLKHGACKYICWGLENIVDFS